MKNYFFIIGLPRTRTSWLANYFTYDNCFCYHEGLKYCSSIEELKHLMDNTNEYNVGNSDCSLIEYIPEIRTVFTNAKFVLVERKANEVVESLLDFQLMEDYDLAEKWIYKLQKQLDEIKKTLNPMIINYNDLNDIQICKSLWQYILPNVPFNENRWHLLDELYVNILIGKSYNRMIPRSLFGKFSQRKSS